MFGSRCLRHWMHRQASYRKLPTHQKWWEKYEPILRGAIALRLMFPDEVQEPNVRLTGHAKKWEPLVVELILAADAAGRRQCSKQKS